MIQTAEKGHHQLFVSTISLMEIMYLTETNRIPLSLAEVLENLNSKKCYTIIDFDVDILKEAVDIQFVELHDRLILATAKLLGTPIVSSDREFNNLKDVEVIW